MPLHGSALRLTKDHRLAITGISDGRLIRGHCTRFAGFHFKCLVAQNDSFVVVVGEIPSE